MKKILAAISLLMLLIVPSFSADASTETKGQEQEWESIVCPAIENITMSVSPPTVPGYDATYEISVNDDSGFIQGQTIWVNPEISGKSELPSPKINGGKLVKIVAEDVTHHKLQALFNTPVKYRINCHYNLNFSYEPREHSPAREYILSLVLLPNTICKGGGQEITPSVPYGKSLEEGESAGKAYVSCRSTE